MATCLTICICSRSLTDESDSWWNDGSGMSSSMLFWWVSLRTALTICFVWESNRSISKEDDEDERCPLDLLELIVVSGESIWSNDEVVGLDENYHQECALLCSSLIKWLTFESKLVRCWSRRFASLFSVTLFRLWAVEGSTQTAHSSLWMAFVLLWIRLTMCALLLGKDGFGGISSGAGVVTMTDADCKIFPVFCWWSARRSWRIDFKRVSSWVKLGRAVDSYAQQWSHRSNNAWGQYEPGSGSRTPFSIWVITSAFAMPWNGFLPIVKISHMQTANIHTSDKWVKRRKLIDSGAIHLIGSFPFEASKKRISSLQNQRSSYGLTFVVRTIERQLSR